MTVDFFREISEKANRFGEKPESEKMRNQTTVQPLGKNKQLNQVAKENITNNNVTEILEMFSPFGSVWLIELCGLCRNPLSRFAVSQALYCRVCGWVPPGGVR